MGQDACVVLSGFVKSFFQKFYHLLWAFGSGRGEVFSPLPAHGFPGRHNLLVHLGDGLGKYRQRVIRSCPRVKKGVEIVPRSQLREEH